MGLGFRVWGCCVSLDPTWLREVLRWVSPPMTSRRWPGRAARAMSSLLCGSGASVLHCPATVPMILRGGGGGVVPPQDLAGTV